MNELAMTATTQKFNNKGLNTVTKNILKAGENMTKNAFEIALNLAKVEHEALWKDDEFKSAQEYAEKTFGFKKSKYYNMLALSEYVDKDTKQIVLDKATTDWSVSQITAILPLGTVDTAKSYIADGVINSDMTVKELNEIVKHETADPEEETDGEGNEDSEDVIDTTCKIANYHFELSEYEDGSIKITVNGDEIDNAIIDRAYWADLVNALSVKVAGGLGFEE